MSITTPQTIEFTNAGQGHHSIYPVHFIVNSKDIWLGWQSVDEPENSILKSRDAILWDVTRDGLVKKCRSLLSDISIEDDVVFDLDATLQKLGEYRLDIGDEIINSWNILRDIRSALGPEVRAAFQLDSERLLKTYDRYFSTASGGELLGIEEIDAAPDDVGNAMEVISTGMTMLLHITAANAVRSTS